MVVSGASPLINLTAIGRLDLLRALRQDAGFWMSEALQNRVLEKVGER
jgi:predicted nucleic acid-binding protein